MPVAVDGMAVPRPGARLRLLALHGFRTSGDVLREQVGNSKEKKHTSLRNLNCSDYEAQV